MAVRVTFLYEPDEPDDHEVGMSQAEYDRLMEKLMMLGADNIEMERE